MGTESLLARNTRVNNRAIHDRKWFLLLDSMTCDPSCKSKIGAEVAKESVRNEKITKKSLEAKSSAYAYALKTDVRTHCYDLGVTSKLEPDPMLTLCPGYGLGCADDLSHRSLRATDGRNGVSLEVDATNPYRFLSTPTSASDQVVPVTSGYRFHEERGV
ncbi:hypothetical protein PIB30_102038 [Stylosanthes scabra]|uniref:Uncharacterized protein n=1 Tax=Stylosanthes scabra TaxID=79078 RepID=A0ABU6RY71_9FABA|nr:hypothetical protein [Stylosanthes scabra]